MDPPPDNALQAPLRRLFAAFSDTWRGILVLGAVVAAGFTAGLTLAGWWRMPQRLLRVETHQIIADSIARDLAADLAAIRQLTKQSLCLQVASRRNADWEPCVLSSTYLKP